MSNVLDVIDALVGISSESPVATLRRQRPEVVQYAQNSYETLLQPTDVVGFSLVERGQAALRVASLTENPRLLAHYRHYLSQLGEEPSAIEAIETFPEGVQLSPPLSAMLRHVDLLTHQPAAATPADVTSLQAVGFSTRNIVTLSQLIAFLSFQTRIVTALQLLAGTLETKPSSHPHSWQPRPIYHAQQGFTLDALGWNAWLDTVKLDDATPEQIAVLEESTPTAKTSPYYLLLVQDVEVLRARSRLYNAIMYGPRGLARADRELAALAVSRINGCPYCASIHAQRFAQLTKQPEIVTRLWEEGIETPLEPRQRAIVDYAVKLTRQPSQMNEDDLNDLRTVEFSDWEILDLAHAAAMFAWANRLMQTLGEPVKV
ncbi:MAG: CMD domain protein [Caldilineaceae bacterium]